MAHVEADIVVLGGAGYLGSAFVKSAIARGCRVRVFDRREAKVLHGVPVHALDVRDQAAVLDAITEGSTVVNFAGIADLNLAKNMPREVIETNVLGNINVLEACKARKVAKYCFASTAYVYSQHGSFYRISKRTCEEYIVEYQKRYGVDFLILRYGSLYGGDSNDSNGMHRIIQSALRDGVLRYGGAPSDSREFIHISDASEISLDLVLDGSKNEAFLLTGAERITMEQLFELISEMLGRQFQLEFGGSSATNHYRQTQYNFVPIEAQKIFSNKHVDIGNGLLSLIEKMHLDLNGVDEDVKNALEVDQFD